MKRILLIGGEGYIGSRLMMYLEGFIVESVDLKWHYNMIPANRAVDAAALTKDYILSFDVVVFLTAHSSVKMAADGLSSLNNNLVNFVRILDYLTCSSTKLIYASSSAVYGKSGSIERHETDAVELSADNFYDLTKKDMDLYSRLFDVESYGLRFGTVNGWSPHLRIDIMLNAMSESVKRGSKIRAYNTSVYRPLLGIDDLCRAVLKIINSKEDKRGVYNLASVNGMTVEEIARKAGTILNAEVDYMPGLDEAAYSFSISSEKFKKAYDFQFEDTIQSIIQSLEKQSTINTTRNEPINYGI